MKPYPIFIGETDQKTSELDINGGFVPLLGGEFYKIKNFDSMNPFFMSIVSGSNHWLYIASTGGLSAGRVNADNALFPYYTVDKLTENHESTGNKSILLVTRGDRTSLWEPLTDRFQGIYEIERNLYKNVLGTAVVFEEVNHSLGLSYQYAWRTSDTFGFIKTTWLKNEGNSSCRVELIDGIQNILPANVTAQIQNTFSPLLDAYKRSELDPHTGIGIFALNSTLTDLAEPSESLLATIVMQVGLEQADYLISSTQLDRFRSGKSVTQETEIRGMRGSYFAHTTLDLPAGAQRLWHLVMDINQDCASIVHWSNKLKAGRHQLAKDVERDIELNDRNLEKLVASADGLQVSGDRLSCTHHFANVMFNIMRGGIFADQYRIQTRDFIEFVSIRNRSVLAEGAAFFSSLPPQISVHDLHSKAEASGQQDLIRLTYAYLPLTFSRRHGDPSRPWNCFSIDIKKPDGSLRAGIRRKLARYFPELGSASLLLPRVCREHDLYFSECHNN